MTVTSRRDRWRAAANERIRQILAVRRAGAAATEPTGQPAAKAAGR